jgi:hypothetical protein
MTKNWRIIALTLVLVVGLTAPLLAGYRDDAGPVRLKGTAVTAAGIRALTVHDVGNVRMTMSNWGEQGNPDQTPGYFGFEFPLGSENDFLFSSGVWVGAMVNNQRLVSTGTDGDNGTNEFAPTIDRFVATSKQYTTLAGRDYIMGAKGVDDDGDWTLADDLDGDGRPSVNWDSGHGIIGRDDDWDGLVDEELTNGVDDDEDGLIDEDTSDGDDNGDGNCDYDPETHVDEDPAGDISADYIDNDFDGLVDAADPDFDGDVVPGSNDDDGDGLMDEDGIARGTQEYFTVYDDRDRTQVQNPDADGHTPLNLMVLQRTYAWGEAYAGSFILVDLIIRNVGAVPLTDVYLGLFADPDVAAKGESGDPASVDDWNFYDSEHLMMIQGDDTTDADGFGPGVFAMKVVRTPGPVENLNISFNNFERVAGGDPETNADKYDLISAPSSENATPTPALGDWRFLMGIGPKEGGWFPGDDVNLLMPGQELPVTVAFLGGYNVAEVQRNAEWAQRIYDNDFQGPAAPDQPEFWTEAFPDHIRVYWRDNSEGSVDPITQLRDFEGYALQRSSDTNYWFTLAQYDLINVLSDPEFERENLNLGMPYDPGAPAGTGWRWEIDSTGASPDTVGRVYWFDDYDVLRGWTYYYIVRAFDQGVGGAGVLITPVGRSYQVATAGYTEETATTGSEVEGVYVVPNPYKGGHEQEFSGRVKEGAGIKYYPRKLWFMNLPTTGATIDVFSLAGDHIVTLEHPAGGDLFLWDMRNKYGQEIVSGIYYFVVEGWLPHQSWTQKKGGPIKIDKFVVLK